jgi:hypothetical protein
MITSGKPAPLRADIAASRSNSSTVAKPSEVSYRASQVGSPQRRHIGSGPGLVDEDQPFRSDAILIFDPLGSSQNRLMLFNQIAAHAL